MLRAPKRIASADARSVHVNLYSNGLIGLRRLPQKEYEESLRAINEYACKLIRERGGASYRPPHYAESLAALSELRAALHREEDARG
jgi:hypothetical protein